MLGISALTICPPPSYLQPHHRPRSLPFFRPSETASQQLDQALPRALVDHSPPNIRTANMNQNTMVIVQDYQLCSRARHQPDLVMRDERSCSASHHNGSRKSKPRSLQRHQDGLRLGSMNSPFLFASTPAATANRYLSSLLPPPMRQDLVYRCSSRRVRICHSTYHVLCLGAKLLPPPLKS